MHAPTGKKALSLKIRAVYAGILVSAYDIHRSRKGALLFRVGFIELKYLKNSLGE